MRLSTTKLILFMVFVVCFITTQVAAKYYHKDCDDDNHNDDGHENWDDDNDWNDDNNRNHDNNDNDWDTNNDSDHNNGDWNNSASPTWSGSWPMPTYGQSTSYYPSGVPATVTVTYTQVYTATSVPSDYSNQPQMGSMASVKRIGIPVTLTIIIFTMVIIA